MSTLACLLLFGTFSQSIEFETDQYATVRGEADQILGFYTTWRQIIDANWQTSPNKTWWDKEYARISQDAKLKRVYFAYKRTDKMWFWRAVVRRDCLVWFKVTVQPFGSFYLPYKPSWHMFLTILFLIAFCVAFYYRNAIRQKLRSVI